MESLRVIVFFFQESYCVNLNLCYGGGNRGTNMLFNKLSLYMACGEQCLAFRIHAVLMLMFPIDKDRIDIWCSTLQSIL